MTHDQKRRQVEELRDDDGDLFCGRAVGVNRLARNVMCVSMALASQLVCHAPPLHGQAARATQPLLYAGVGFLESHSRIDSAFPITLSMRAMAESGGRSLTTTFRLAMEQRGLPVSVDLGVRAGPAVAFAFDGEAQVLDRIVVSEGTRWRTTTSLSGQIITFDFSSMQVTSSYPLTVSYVDNLHAPPGPEYRTLVASELLKVFGNLEPSGAFPMALQGMSVVGFNPSSRCRVQVTAVDFDSTLAALASTRFGRDSSALARQVAAVFSKAWITSARQPMLPYRGSQVVDSDMRARFSDSDVYQLQVPPAQFEILLVPIQARRRTLAANRVLRVDRTSVLLGLTVRSTGPAGIVRSTAQYSAAVLDTLPMTMSSPDTWPSTESALKSLASGIARAARSQDAGWLRTNSVNSTGDSPSTLSEWLLQCDQ